MPPPVYIKIDLEPGVIKDDSPLTVGLRLVDSDKIRWVRNGNEAKARAQVVGGWETASNDSVLGVCRGMFGWRSTNSLPQAAIGTTSHLQVFYDGEIYDITPIAERGVLTNPFTTTVSSAVVNVADTAHGRAEGDRVAFSNASAVGGLTIDGEYTVTEVIDVDNYTITASSTASSTAGPGGGTVYYTYYLPTGLVDNLGGDGYGVGGYGVGDYGEGTDITEFFPRTWSFDNFVQNLIACPRGGAIYEWAPTYASPELVQNPTFAATTGWTFGTGWSWSAGQAAATLSSAALSQTSLSINPNSYATAEVIMSSFSSGKTVLSYGSQALATITVSGLTSVQIYGGDGGSTSTISLTGYSATCICTSVSLKQAANAVEISTAPSQNTCILVTPELICLAGGTIDADTGDFNPMQIRSSDTGDGSLAALHDWTPTPENLSRRWTLAKGSRIVRMMNGNGEVLVFTDTSLYGGQYTTDTNIVYQWRLIATGCGLIGPNAVAVLSGAAYWITPAGEFMGYAGGMPQELNCPMSRWLKGIIAPAQGDKIYAQENTEFGEIDWAIPTLAGDNEIAVYIKYHPRQNVWANGTRDWTAFLDTGAFSYPLSTSLDGVLYFYEKGTSADGNPISWSMVTGAFDLSEGNNLMDILGFIPDFEDMVGGCSVTVSAYLYPASTAVDNGPFNVTQLTNIVDFRSRGRQCSLTISGNAAPAFMRNGTHRLKLAKSGALR